MAQGVLERAHHAGVLGHAAGHDHLVLDADAVGQAGHPAGHRLVDAVDDVPLVGALRQLADDLALGEDSAGGADAHVLGGLSAQGAQVLHVHLQHPGHHVQEAPGAGGTLVIHLEVGHDAVFHPHDLHVLAADVDDGAHLREEEGGPLGVAAQLAHLVVGELLQGVAAVAGGQDEGHVIPLFPGLFQHLVDGPLGPAGARPHVDEGLGHDLLAVGEHDALGRGGTDVDSQGIDTHMLVLLWFDVRGGEGAAPYRAIL